jgi:hypothetical protein
VRPVELKAAGGSLALCVQGYDLFFARRHRLRLDPCCPVLVATRAVHRELPHTPSLRRQTRPRNSAGSSYGCSPVSCVRTQLSSPRNKQFTSSRPGTKWCQGVPGPNQDARYFTYSSHVSRKREPTSGLEPLTCSLRVIGQALQGTANAAYIEGFPFPALPHVAPYCAPGGIRVVSISPSHLPNTVAHF